MAPPRGVGGRAGPLQRPGSASRRPLFPGQALLAIEAVDQVAAADQQQEWAAGNSSDDQRGVRRWCGRAGLVPFRNAPLQYEAVHHALGAGAHFGTHQQPRQRAG